MPKKQKVFFSSVAQIKEAFRDHVDVFAYNDGRLVLDCNEETMETFCYLGRRYETLPTKMALPRTFAYID